MAKKKKQQDVTESSFNWALYFSLASEGGKSTTVNINGQEFKTQSVIDAIRDNGIIDKLIASDPEATDAFPWTDFFNQQLDLREIGLVKLRRKTKEELSVIGKLGGKPVDKERLSIAHDILRSHPPKKLDCASARILADYLNRLTTPNLFKHNWVNRHLKSFIKK